MTQVSEQPTQESPETSVYEAPGSPASIVEVKPRYENFIGGHWIVPATGQYSENKSPATGQPLTVVPKSGPDEGGSLHANIK